MKGWILARLVLAVRNMSRISLSSLIVMMLGCGARAPVSAGNGGGANMSADGASIFGGSTTEPMADQTGDARDAVGGNDDSLPSSAPADGAAGGGGMISGCSTLVPRCGAIRTGYSSGPPPDLGHGGAIVDGTYDIVEDDTYLTTAIASDGPGDCEAIRISGGGTRLEYVTASTGFTILEAIAPSGASLNPQTLCPGPGVSVGPYYTATADTFAAINGLFVMVFVRRPEDAGSD